MLNNSFYFTIFLSSLSYNIKKHNGDAGHENNLVVKDNTTGQNLYQTGEFTEFEARNQTFNEVGEYTMKIQGSGAERILVLWGISNTDLCKYTSSISRDLPRTAV